MAQATYQSSNLSDQANHVGKDVTEKAAEYAGKASKQIDKALETAESTVRDLAARGSEAGERVQEVAGHMKEAIDKSVKTQPMATLAITAAIGFLLGALWKSK